MAYLIAIIAHAGFVLIGFGMIKLDRNQLHPWLVTAGAIITALVSIWDLLPYFGFFSQLLPSLHSQFAFDLSRLVNAMGSVLLALGLIGFGFRYSKELRGPAKP